MRACVLDTGVDLYPCICGHKRDIGVLARGAAISLASVFTSRALAKVAVRACTIQSGNSLLARFNPAISKELHRCYVHYHSAVDKCT